MIILDIETKNPIATGRELRVPNVKYAEGWTDFYGMGISVVGVYDYATDSSRVFCEDNLTELEKLLEETNVICGFNNLRFDHKLLQANYINIPAEKTYDLLREIWRFLGILDEFDARGFSNAHKGFSLGAMAQANSFGSKSGNGADAPLDWQSKKIGKVIDYCFSDVSLTKKLIDKLIRKDFLINPKTGEKMFLRKHGA